MNTTKQSEMKQQAKFLKLSKVIIQDGRILTNG
jgi:hypothetical protein